VNPEHDRNIISPRGARVGRELTHSRLAAFALPSFSLAFLFVPITSFLPAFYASTLHVDLAVIGLFLLASRSLDVVIDPLIGKWSDNTPERFGRRKFWMWIGTPFIMAGAYFLLMPQVTPSGWYLLFASFAIYLGGSCVGLSYAAWGTEIVETYHGRTRLAAFRETAGLLGSVLAASIPALTMRHGVDRFTMSILGWMIIILTPITILIAVLAVGKIPTRKRKADVTWFESILAVWGNRPFRILCGAYFLFSVGGSIVNATLVFYVSNYLGQKEIVGPTFAILPLATVASIPAWLAVSRRIGKHRAIAYSLFASVAIFLVVVPQLRPGQGWWFVGTVAVLAAVSGGYQALPSGIVGDVVDYDTLRHHHVRSGIFWGIWASAQKIAPALGIGLTLPLLKIWGFDPGGQSTVTGLLALKYTFCFGIIPFLLAGAVLLLQFPIDARRHDIIRRRLDARARRDGEERADDEADAREIQSI
jgi:GPH family glycoside/pentoside/hexuronide:cation symporter